MRYICCACDFDVTALVERAFEEELISIRLEMAQTVEQRESVVVTCPNGHTCRYTQA